MNRRERRTAWIRHYRLGNGSGGSSRRGVNDAGLAPVWSSSAASAADSAHRESATSHRVPSIELRIEALVLSGLESGTRDRDRIGAAVQMELTRLLASRGLPTGMTGAGEEAQLDAGSFVLMPNAPGHAVGIQLARAVYGGMKR